MFERLRLACFANGMSLEQSDAEFRPSNKYIVRKITNCYDDNRDMNNNIFTTSLTYKNKNCGSQLIHCGPLPNLQLVFNYSVISI